MHVHGYVYVYVGLGPSTFIVHLCPSTSTIELCNRIPNWSPRSAPLISQARGGTFKRYRNPLEICVFVNIARIDATQLVATTRLWHGQMLIFLVEILTFLISSQVVATPWVATTCAMLINTHIFNGFWHVLKLPYLTWIPRNAGIAKYIMFFHHFERRLLPHGRRKCFSRSLRDLEILNREMSLPKSWRQFSLNQNVDISIVISTFFWRR